jgi:hypothetical protein
MTGEEAAAAAAAAVAASTAGAAAADDDAAEAARGRIRFMAIQRAGAIEFYSKRAQRD